MIKISQDKEFLLAQREKGRRESTLGVDKQLEKMQKMADFRKNASLKRSQQMKKKCEEVEATAQLVSSNESDEFEQEEQASFTIKEVDIQKGNKKRMKVMTPYLAAALHRSKVSDRKAVFVVAETARSLGYEVDEITLSRSSIRRESQFTITPTEEKRIAKDMYICYTCVFKSLDDSFFTLKCTIQ
ncbi:hypothetical protein AVEN_102573-1 [Araneus ventricosus]|uniref:Uncharacterized protein n=1 Tax=Araneus ventricosus TaxID=182803 RepID=A0A4Y2BLA2_ARAVE|nr:hypothetical protein AVEN_102573-1 [Araneus ventricosus]